MYVTAVICVYILCCYLMIDKNLLELAEITIEDFLPVNDPLVSQDVIGSKAEEILLNYQQYFRTNVARWRQGARDWPMTNFHAIKGDTYDWDELDISQYSPTTESP